MSVINTNITALVSQKNLSSSQNALSTAMERLSSGLRINSAKDDAAGLAISNRISSQITGLMQAQRNANDGISISQTAEGALNQVNDNLQRIRELTVQSANETNSESDLTSIQNEITLRLDEIDRISDTTSFNGVKVLSAEQGVSIQVGANDGETITMNLREMTASELGLTGFDVSNQRLSTSISASAVTETVPEVAESANISAASFTDTAAAATYTIAVQNADPDNFVVVNGGEAYAGSYDAATDTVTFDSSSVVATTGAIASDYTAVSGSTAGVNIGGGVTVAAEDLEDGAFVNTNAAATPELYVDEAGGYYVTTDGGTSFVEATVDLDSNSATYGRVEFDSVSGTAATTAEITVLNAGTALTDVADPTELVPAVTIDTSGLDTDLVGTSAAVHTVDGGGYVVKGTNADGNEVTYEASVDTGTGAVTLGEQVSVDPLKKLDDALTSVDVLRSELGAAQNRFESAISNLATTQTNLSAARSRILDADYAVEVSNLTRAQILQQAGTSVLAQANQVPQTVLSLLR